MAKPSFPAEFTLTFSFDPVEDRFVVTGDILDEFFPDEVFGAEDLYSTFEELGDAFGDMFESEEEE
jgi:hypothetical protein